MNCVPEEDTLYCHNQNLKTLNFPKLHGATLIKGASKKTKKQEVKITAKTG
jgi:hypothetical protein